VVRPILIEPFRSCIEIVSDDTGEFVPFVEDDFVDPKLDGTGELGFLVSNAKSITVSLDFNCFC